MLIESYENIQCLFEETLSKFRTGFCSGIDDTEEQLIQKVAELSSSQCLTLENFHAAHCALICNTLLENRITDKQISIALLLEQINLLSDEDRYNCLYRFFMAWENEKYSEDHICYKLFAAMPEINGKKFLQDTKSEGSLSRDDFVEAIESCYMNNSFLISLKYKLLRNMQNPLEAREVLLAIPRVTEKRKAFLSNYPRFAQILAELINAQCEPLGDVLYYLEQLPENLVINPLLAGVLCKALVMAEVEDDVFIIFKVILTLSRNEALNTHNFVFALNQQREKKYTSTMQDKAEPPNSTVPSTQPLVEPAQTIGPSRKYVAWANPIQTVKMFIVDDVDQPTVNSSASSFGQDF